MKNDIHLLSQMIDGRVQIAVDSQDMPLPAVSLENIEDVILTMSSMNEKVFKKYVFEVMLHFMRQYAQDKSFNFTHMSLFIDYIVGDSSSGIAISGCKVKQSNFEWFFSKADSLLIAKWLKLVSSWSDMKYFSSELEQIHSHLIDGRKRGRESF